MGQPTDRLPKKILAGIKYFDPGTEFTTYSEIIGTYARLRYLDATIAALKDWIPLKTVQPSDGKEQYTTAASKEMGKKIKELAESSDYNLEFKNVNDQIYFVILRADPNLRGSQSNNELVTGKGQIPGAVSLSMHLDVVDAIETDWGLKCDLPPSEENKDLAQLSPWMATEVSNAQLQECFSAEKIAASNGYLVGDRIYGRGTEDNKGSIASTMAALAALQEAQIPFFKDEDQTRDIYLLVETTEESTWTAMSNFKKEYKIPQHNIGLDSKYPVVTGEKGYGDFKVTMAAQEVSGEANLPYVESISGGASTSQIPQNSTVVIVDPNNSLSEELLESVAATYSTGITNSECKPFSSEVIDVEPSPKGTKYHLQFKGKSKSAYLPEEAVNPVTRAFHFVYELAQNGAPLELSETAESCELASRIENPLNYSLGSPAENNAANGSENPKVYLEKNVYISAAQFVIDNFGYKYDGSLLGGPEAGDSRGVAFTDPYDKNGALSEAPGFTGATTVVLTQVSSNEDGSLKLTSNTRIPMGIAAKDFRDNVLALLEGYKANSELKMSIEYGDWFDNARRIAPDGETLGKNA